MTRLIRLLKGENVGNSAPQRAPSFYLPRMHYVCTRGTYASLHIARSLSLSFVPHVSLSCSPSFSFESLGAHPWHERTRAVVCRRRPPLATNKKIISRSNEPTFFSIALHPRGMAHLSFRADRLLKI